MYEIFIKYLYYSSFLFYVIKDVVNDIVFVFVFVDRIFIN